jgi:hypothetical protein
VGSNRLIRYVFEVILLVAVAVVLISVGVSTALFAGILIGALLVLVGIEMLVFGLRPPQHAVDEEALPLHEGGVVREPEEAPLEPEMPVVAVAEPEPEPEPEAEPEPEPEPAPPPVPPGEDGAAVVELPLRGGPREWNLWDLERRARERHGQDPYRDEEWSALFVYLREYASPDGMLPADFDDLVRSSFGELLSAGRL